MTLAVGVADDREPGTVSWRELLVEARRRLAVLDAPHEARWMVAEAAGFDDATLMIQLDDFVTERAMARFDSMMERRLHGEPLQYVLGHWPFRNLDLLVDRRALIPRPETESMVSAALVVLDELGGAQRPTVVVDLGTGTGAIGLSIAVERPRAEVWLSERDASAVELARANISGIGRAGTRVRLVQGNWFAALPEELAGRIDLVVTNPPYVAEDEDLPTGVDNWEPNGALRSGVDGLDDLRRIVADAPSWLRAGGAVVVEHGSTQSRAVQELMRQAGLRPKPGRDDAGLDRWVIGRAEVVAS